MSTKCILVRNYEIRAPGASSLSLYGDRLAGILKVREHLLGEHASERDQIQRCCIVQVYHKVVASREGSRRRTQSLPYS